MRKMVFVLAVMFCCAAANAQQMSDAYLREFGEQEQFRMPVSDTGLLWGMPGDGTTLFGQLSRYNFNFVSYRNRGYDGLLQRHLMGGLDATFATAGYPDYTLYGALRVAAPLFSEGMGTGLHAALPAAPVCYGLRVSQAREGISARLHYSERRYRGGARLSTAGALGGGWHAIFNGQYRAGEDKFIDGVFSESAVISGGLEKDMGRAGALSIMGLWSSSQRGMRSWTVQEAYDLTGDNLYNPAWGWYGGRKRNSRVRNDADLMLTANYGLRLSEATQLSVSALWRSGERAVSGLAWWDAQNPSPDHYTKLPGYSYDQDNPDRDTNPWYTRDGRYTQLGWEDMWYANAFPAAGQSVFIVEERVERAHNFRAAAAAAYRKGRLEADYGVRFNRDRSNFFRRAKDLLGGEYVMDYDQYLIDDVAYGDKYHNDMRDPERRVRRGDRYGYDYDICRTEVTAFGSGRLREGRWLLDFGAELGFPEIFREGRNEKENFPGAKSRGRSESIAFTTYSAGMRAAYSLSQLHQISASAFVQEREPQYRNIFLAPDNHNLTTNVPRNIFLAGGEFTYRGALSPAVSVDVSAYYTRSAGETETYRYWDDIFTEFVLMPVSDVAKTFAGAELGLQADITNRLRLLAGISLNSYKYASGGVAEVYSDRDMRKLLTGAAVGLDGYVCSSSPQTLATAALRYSIPYSWSFEATFAWAAGRYVSPDPVRRMERVAALASSPEALASFAEQERLPNAAVVNLRVTKSFTLAGCSIFASVSVDNLLGRNDIIYGGYEQMRIRKSGSGINRTYSPFPSRYGYAYPRSVQAMLIINL